MIQITERIKQSILTVINEYEPLKPYTEQHTEIQI